MLTSLRLLVWRLMRPLQWRVLWLVNDNFMVAVSGVVFNDMNEVLLLRHRYWPQGSWGLPGGYAKKLERLEDTLRREVLEETGYAVETTGLLCVVSGYRLRLEAHYSGRLLGGDLRLDHEEVLEARFFATDDLPAGILPSHRELVATAVANRNQGLL